LSRAQRLPQPAGAVSDAAASGGRTTTSTDASEMPTPRDLDSRDGRPAPSVTIEQIGADVWRAAFRDATGMVLMTVDAATADLAFRRLRERSLAAGHDWTSYGADEP